MNETKNTKFINNRIKRQRKESLIYFLLPAVIFINIILIIPLLYSLGISFTKWIFSMPGSLGQFAGFSNYVEIVTDINFWKSVRTTILFSSTSIIVELILGIFFAVLLNKKFFGRGFFRAIIIIPMVIAPAIIGQFWSLLYDQNGIFNFLLEFVGFSRINWLDINTAIWSMVIVDVWQWLPFVVIIILAGLQSINISMIEAAKVDGASNSKIFWFIEFPALVPFIIVVLFFRLTDALREFDKIFILTQGGPGSETRVLSIYNYEAGFHVMELAKSSSISWFFAILMIIIIFPILMFLFRRIQD
jgi:multiple sugar transport system permease protein/sorbitol/mannitol transport system permease protein